MDLLSWPPRAFVVVALVAALLEGARGLGNRWTHAKATRGLPWGGAGWRRWAPFLLWRCLPDVILYVASSLAAFTSLWLAYRVLVVVERFRDLQVGPAAVFIFLALFGVVGVAGQLPHLLQEGKFPK